MAKNTVTASRLIGRRRIIWGQKTFSTLLGYLISIIGSRQARRSQKLIVNAKTPLLISIALEEQARDLADMNAEQ